MWRARFLVATAGMFVPSALAHETFLGLGIPSGAYATAAASLSADGSVVAGTASYPFSGDPRAFRWTRTGGMTLLSVSGQTQSFKISADGSTVVGDYFEQWPPGVTTAGYKWGPHGLVLAPPWYDQVARGVSADGSLVVGRVEASFNAPAQAYSWSGNTLTLLAGGSTANGASWDGSVIVGAAGIAAARWNNGALSTLGQVPGFASSEALDVSADGSVIIGTLGFASRHAFRWTQASGMVDLGLIADTTTASAAAVSADGTTIVGTSGAVACVWTQTGGPFDLRQLLLDGGVSAVAGWHLSAASGVSGDGSTIVGWGTNPNGHTEAWVATIPEPALAVPLIIAAAWSRRQRRPAASIQSALPWRASGS